MNSKSNNIKIMISGEADEVIEKLFNLLKKRYQNNLQSMRDSEFVIDYVYYCIIIVKKKISIVLNHI